jgi:hypothetical protein
MASAYTNGALRVSTRNCSHPPQHIRITAIPMLPILDFR